MNKQIEPADPRTLGFIYFAVILGMLAMMLYTNQWAYTLVGLPIYCVIATRAGHCLFPDE